MTFGERLRKFRKYRKISCKDLAAKTGLHVSGISHFETGKREPTLSSLVKLLSVLKPKGDSLAWLLGIVEQEPKDIFLELTHDELEFLHLVKRALFQRHKREIAERRKVERAKDRSNTNIPE